MDVDDSFLDYFGYDSPWEAQLSGMETVHDTVGDNGFVLLEGACGTGKTMLSLTPLISLVRSNETKFERILVVTSVKQQQKVFVSDLNQINSNLPSDTQPVSGLVVVGKQDVCPYVHEGKISSENIQTECERLRQNTRELVDESQNSFQRAKSLKATVESDTEWSSNITAPYHSTIPKEPVDHCPFYAEHIANTIEDEDDLSTVPITLHNQGVINTDQLINESTAAGTCPHSVMTEVMNEVEVVIANYVHVFNSDIANGFTEALIDDKTLIVCDEAHNLVEKTRSYLSKDISVTTLHKCINQLDSIITYLEQDKQTLTDLKSKQGASTELLPTEQKEVAEMIERRIQQGEEIANSTEEYIEFAIQTIEYFNTSELSKDNLEDYKSLVSKFLSITDRKVTSYLEEEYGSYWTDKNIEDDEIPLRDPEKVEQDDISSMLSLSGFSSKSMKEADKIATVLDPLLKHLFEEIRDVQEVQKPSVTTLNFISDWGGNDHSKYFRELVIEENKLSPTISEYTWESYLNVKLAIQNCIPSDELADRFDDFGGGILMSATLEPLDMYKIVSGLGELENKGRKVTQERFGLHFPKENRESLVIPLTKYKRSNRASARNDYISAIETVVRNTPGNILVSMNSYEEAEKIGNSLERRVNCPIIIDRSSSNRLTDRVKNKFFNSDKAVLLTSAHGTLVEGVDYYGDRLDTVIVCGVPIREYNSPRKKAIRNAFEDDERFEGDSFDYAFGIPATRKTRQSIGRVIRSDSDKGVRILIDKRYLDDPWDSVTHLFPKEEISEFKKTHPSELKTKINTFWE